MVHERDQRPAGQVLRSDVPVTVPVRPEPVFLRFPQQEPAIRGGSRRDKTAGVPRRHAGPVQLQPRCRAHEPRLVPGRRRSHLPHRPCGVPAQGLHTADRHRYVLSVLDANCPRRPEQLKSILYRTATGNVRLEFKFRTSRTELAGSKRIPPRNERSN